jgi:phage terminase Nu1 subunit (DNA packaging protein)
VAREWEHIVRQTRSAVLARTSRIRAALPHLTAHDADVIDRELRAALTALADGGGP